MGEEGGEYEGRGRESVGEEQRGEDRRGQRTGDEGRRGKGTVRGEEREVNGRKEGLGKQMEKRRAKRKRGNRQITERGSVGTH